MRKEIADEFANRIIAKLEEGVVPWRKPWTVSGVMPHNFVSGKPYRGINIMLLAISSIDSGFTTPAWMTYKQALEKGGQVRRGETGTRIVFWNPVKKVDEATGEERSRLVSKVYTVFNVDQIDGIEWTAPGASVIEVPDALKGVMETYEDAPSIVWAASDRAFYDPRADRITLPLVEQFETIEGYAETFCHEVVHSTGHPSRLDRFGLDAQCREDYAAEELVAEIGASMLAQSVGIVPDDRQTVAYVASWLRALRDDRSLVVTAAQRAQKAVDLVLGHQPT